MRGKRARGVAFLAFRVIEQRGPVEVFSGSRNVRVV